VVFEERLEEMMEKAVMRASIYMLDLWSEWQNCLQACSNSSANSP
jgi:hypothetical protein